MDPYLEDDQLWPGFQHHLVHSLYHLFLPGLLDRYRARVCQRDYATEQALFTSVVRQEHRESFLEIRQRGDGRLVTLLDLASPTNKMHAQGREAYLQKRREAQACHCNLVEVDLVLQGQPLLDYSRDGLPQWDYAVTVTRAAKPEQFEIYTATLEKPLPRFRLPLASDDRDTVVDLQAAFHRAFDLGNYLEKIDYEREPVAKLDDDDRAYLDQRLRKQKVRKQGA